MLDIYRACAAITKPGGFVVVTKNTRATRGLSQEELGHRAHLRRNYIGAIERGEINPTFRVLLKLERGLDMPLSKLIARYEELLATRTIAEAQAEKPTDA